MRLVQSMCARLRVDEEECVLRSGREDPDAGGVATGLGAGETLQPSSVRLTRIRVLSVQGRGTFGAHSKKGRLWGGCMHAPE